MNINITCDKQDCHLKLDYNASGPAHSFNEDKYQKLSQKINDFILFNHMKDGSDENDYVMGWNECAEELKSCFLKIFLEN